MIGLDLMKMFSLFVILTVTGGNASACERSLAGTWKSDRQATMAFVRENAKLQSKTEDFLQALVGHMTLTFRKNELHLVMPDIEVPVSGEKRPFAGFEERKPYKMLFCSASMIVFSTKGSFSDSHEATTFNFVGPDTVWVYMGTTRSGVPDINAREYFQRIR